MASIEGMDDQLDLVEAALVALCCRTAGRAAVGMSPGELMGVNEAFGALRRMVDAAYAPVVAEIARQSRPELGKESLAKRQGFRTPARLISATTGASVPEAIKLVAVGEATAPRVSLVGETLPAKHPHVADALAVGRLSVTAASEITRLLDALPPRVAPAAVAGMEKTLVDAAPGLTSDELRKLLVRAEAILDPDGVESRERELREARYLIVREDRTGAIVVDGRFDPEAGAPIKAALDGMVGGMLRRRDRHQRPRAAGSDRATEHSDARADDPGHAGVPGCDDAVGGDRHSDAGQDHDGDTAVRGTADAHGHDDTADPMADPRSMKQMYADALADVCRHALGCEQTPTGPSTTVIVRMNLTDLEDRVGTGTIDGITRPVSASTVRRMAADAQVIPVVLGEDSEILDWGRAKRLFTPAQKLATTERDGGCACCGLPPAMTVVHHLKWWARDGGRTDLNNAIALCVACHHRTHDDGCDIHIDGVRTPAKVSFTPPPWLDSTRTPRLGGRARFDLVA